MYIVLAILIFGLLIAVHELGHFLAAKACGVRVLEFSMGMGPVLLKKQGRETLYSLRLLPIGGFCAMDGEDEESEDPRAFTNQSFLKRFIILVAGSFMNLVLGFVIIACLLAGTQQFVTTQIDHIADGFPYEGEQGFMVGDSIYKIDGHRTYNTMNVRLFLQRSEGRPADFVLIRDGKKVELNNFLLEKQDYGVDGETDIRYGFNFTAEEATFLAKLRESWFSTVDNVRIVWVGLGDLFTGAVGLKELSGPVGIVDIMNDFGKQAPTVKAGVLSILNLGALIAINLAVMNMLPIPALDGGRILFMVINTGVRKIFKRDINPKYEGYIHAAFLIALMGLMVVVMFNDIMRIVSV